LDRFQIEDFGEHLHHKVSESIIEFVCTSREPLLQNDLLEAESFNESASILELGLCSVMCVPLIFEGELLGVIYVGSRRPTHTFQQLDLKTLCIFSAQAATLLKHHLNQESLIHDNKKLKGALEDYKYGSMIGHSQIMRTVFERIDRLSPSDINLLVMGESGTGKELIAREVHRRSKRKDQPFIAINCGALPSTLIESELFGYQKGAFTGAVSDKPGSLSSAQGGTLFLDEIGELPLVLQVKLLRVLEERTFTPLGSRESIPLDIRLICATNKDLQEAVDSGSFRLDLYYRINSFELTLPPLRERGEDIILLAKFLLERASNHYERDLKPISLEAQRGIRRYSWPGNIRELENRIAQAVILADGSEITLQDLNLSKELLNDQILSLKEAQERFSQEYVQHVLSLNQGNRTQAARDLGVDPRTVFRYLEKISDV
ncbi:MAG: Fis family transcriptional regulator, partial [Myxococcales bacterium]|nr:Fis family transcriptional regulator [Myxococcales bacterium]